MNVRNIPAAFLSVALCAAFAGCDEKIAEERDVDVKDDGTVVETKETVTEKADGSIVHEKSKEVDRPADRDADDDKDAEVKVKVDKD